MKIRHLGAGTILAFLAIAFLFPIVLLVLLISLPSFDDLWFDDDLVKRLRAVSSKSGLIRGEDVTAGMADVLPAGMPAEHAIHYLKANGFACGDKASLISDGELACKREAGRFPCGETWKVRLTLAPDHTIAGRRATLDVVCL